ncbi:MAG: LPS-assembly protein LptD [Gallionella sp.]|jgi:LPS-assembly protein|nr:LPS-assembly protein LptD [Gallionella sp.]
MRLPLGLVLLLLPSVFASIARAEEPLQLKLDKTFMSLPESAEETPAFVEADQLTGKKENQIEATGNAILRKRGQSIRADRLLYFQDTEDLDAEGSVVVEQAGNTMSGPHLLLNLDSGAGLMTQPVYFIAENSSRGRADVMHIQDAQHYTLENATYTTCRADDEDWLLRMRGLDIDRKNDIGVAHHAWVEFMGAPLLYSPWMDFPLSDRRKSGFLAPVFGSTTQGGTDLSLSYYWNIAPNFDATFSPRVMTKRGVLLNNEFRYLEPDYAGELHLDVLPTDRLANRSRSHVSLMHAHNLGGGFSSHLNLNRVSDDGYYRDLADSVTTTSQVNLLREGTLNYAAGGWNATARVQRYQTLQDPAAPIVTPYARLPQLTLGSQQRISWADLAFAGEYVDFSHPTLVNAQRLVLNPSVSVPLIRDPAYYLTPKFSAHSTYYSMSANNAAALPNASRTLPIFSLDSGMAFERDWQLFGNDYLHTLEPRVFYVYVPYQDQSQLPNFDSAQADFSFTQMFAENRFFGSDRIGDANQVTVAVTSRLLSQQNGMERLKLTLGERFSFSPPRVNLVTPAVSTNRSDILLGASGQLTDAWSLDGEWQYDPNQSQTQRYNVSARFRPESGKVINLGYRFTRNTLRQADISTQWPLSHRWHAVARWNYSFQDRRLLEGIVGLEYNQDCWTFRLVAQRFTVGTQQINTGIFVQLELNDLVKVGSDPLQILKKSVPGYTKLNDKPVEKTTQVLR